MEQKRIPFLWADGQLPPSLSLLGLSLPPLAVYSIWRTVTRVRASPRETIVHGGIASFFHCSCLASIGFARRARGRLSNHGTGSSTVFWTPFERGRRKKAWSLLPQCRAIKFCHLIYSHPRSSIIVASCAAMRWSLVHIEG